MVEQLYESTETLSEDLTKGEEMDVSVLVAQRFYGRYVVMFSKLDFLMTSG